MEASEYTAADGTIMKIESLEVGQAVTMVTPEGEMPAAEGSLTLEDGTILTIDAEGKISAITPPVAEVETETETPAAGQMDMAKIRAEFSALVAEKDERIKAIESANNAMIEQNKKVLAQFSELLKVVEEIGAQTPAPISKQTNPAKPLSKAEQIAQFFANQA